MNVSDLNVESDPKSFEDRFARCRRLLQFLAARILGSQDEAEDAVRNCRAAASRNPPSFESEGAYACFSTPSNKLWPPRSWMVMEYGAVQCRHVAGD